MGYRDYLSTPPEGHPLWEKFLQSPATWVILGSNVAIFLVAQFLERHEAFLEFGAIERPAVWAGEYWRFVTAIFLHAGWMHLFWNTWAMFGWCAAVERDLGWQRFVVAYLMTGIAGCAASLLGHDASGVGASGAGFGIIGVSLAVWYTRLGSWDAFIHNEAVRNVLLWAAIWIVLGFTLMTNLDNYAHLGGLVAGFGIGYLMAGEPSHDRRLRIVAIAAFVLIWSGAVVNAAYPFFGQTSQRGPDPTEEAERLFEKGEYREAARKLEILALQERPDARRFMLIGECYERALDFRTALLWYQKAEEREPSRELFAALERCFRALGQKEKAEEYRRKQGR